MKIIFNEEEKKIIDQASDITDVDYSDLKLEELFYVIKDLMYEYNNLKEELDYEIKDKEENYEQKKVNYYINYGLSEKNFH